MAKSSRILVMKSKEKIGKNKVEKREQTADEQINAIVNFINTIAYAPGIEFTDNWQFGGRSSISIFVNLFIWYLIVYTFVKKFPDKECITLVGGSALTLTVAAKLGFVWLKHKEFMSLIKFILKVYTENRSGFRELILARTVKRITRHFKILFTGLVFGVGLYSCYPCYDFIFNGNLTLVSPLIMPHVNEENLTGYLILTVMNIVAVVWNVFLCTYAVSCLFLTYVDVYAGLVSLIEEDFRMFDDMCKNKADTNKRKLAFRNITMELMDLARFNAFMNKLFSVIATVQITMCCCGIVACLFAFLAIDYVSGVGGAAYFTTELMMFCYIGQLLDNTSTRTITVISNSKWYFYDTKYQKDMLLALNIFQNLKPIRIANVYPLNFETGLQIVKKIYTILMFMLNMLN